LSLLVWDVTLAFIPFAPFPHLNRATSKLRAPVVHSGLPRYWTWFQKEFPEARAILGKHDKLDHVYVDVQSYLHMASMKSDNETKVRRSLSRDINRLLHSSAPPLRSVTLAADGPAPLPKLLTQRARRRNAGSKGNGKKRRLSSLLLSPGTNFMAELNDDLESFSHRKSREKILGRPRVISDGPLVPGEGEVKLLGHLYQKDQEEAVRSDATQFRRHAIYGGDSDLIIMQLVAYARLCLAQNQTTTRQVDRAKRSNSLKGVSSARRKSSSKSSLDVLVIDTDGQIVSAKKVAEVIRREIIGESSNHSTELALRAMLDLALISMLCRGNDYLPGLAGGSLEEMWHTYMNQLAAASGKGSLEDLFLVSLQSSKGRASISWGAVANLLFSTNERLLELGGARKKSNQKGTWHQAPMSQTERSDARLYAKALIWNLNMYLSGECTDYRFGPIIPPIKSVTLWQLAMQLKDDALDSKSLSLLRRSRPVVPATYNLLVQPLAGKHLVAPALQPLMEETSPISWLYSRGCTCAECYRLYQQSLPFQRAIQKFAARSDETMVAKYDAAQAENRLVQDKIRKHVNAAHGGKSLLFKELPSVPSVEKLAEEARSRFSAHSPEHEGQKIQEIVVNREKREEDNPRAQQQSKNREYDERSWKLWKPRRFRWRRPTAKQQPRGTSSSLLDIPQAFGDALN